MRLRLLNDGKIAGWVWVNLYSLLNLSIGYGILFSDAVAARVSKCLAFFIAINASVFASYTFRNINKVKACVSAVLPGAFKPEEKEEP